MQTMTSNPRGRFVVALLWICILLITAGAAGCSNTNRETPDGPSPFPVHGKVMYKGKPAEGFAVAFHPNTPWDGVQFAPSALTDAKGEFQLHSYGENDGAPIGEYTVTFTWPKKVPGPDPDEGMETVDQLRGRYNDTRKSKFKATVVEGDNMLEPFELN